MTPIERLKAVLCDPEGKCCIRGSDDDRRLVDEALAALEQQPADEPVAIYRGSDSTAITYKSAGVVDILKPLKSNTALYTHPQTERVALTVKEIVAFVGTHEFGPEHLKWFRFGEAAHGIKGAQPEPESFQGRVKPWMLSCFGGEIANDLQERNHRFLEEALELVQSCGCSQTEAHQLVDYVFGRPVGEKIQEVGGVMVTLAALCLAQQVDMHDAGETELARIWTKVEQIRAKQAAKPKHSPLPEHPSQPVAQPERVPGKMPLFEQHQGANYGESHEEGYINGWNACVDAMLAAAPQPIALREQGNQDCFDVLVSKLANVRSIGASRLPSVDLATIDDAIAVLRTYPQPKRSPLTVEQIWENDDLMSFNSQVGLPISTLIKIVEVVEAAHDIQ